MSRRRTHGHVIGLPLPFSPVMKERRAHRQRRLRCLLVELNAYRAHHPDVRQRVALWGMGCNVDNVRDHPALIMREKLTATRGKPAGPFEMIEEE